MVGSAAGSKTRPLHYLCLYCSTFSSYSLYSLGEAPSVRGGTAPWGLLVPTPLSIVTSPAIGLVFIDEISLSWQLLVLVLQLTVHPVTVLFLLACIIVQKSGKATE